MLPTINPITSSVAAIAMQRHLSELQSIHQVSTEQNQGNVLVIVKFPANDGFSCDGARWKDYKERVPYDNLFDAGSLKIRSLLQRRPQERMRRRLGMLTLPDGIDVSLPVYLSLFLFSIFSLSGQTLPSLVKSLLHLWLTSHSPVTCQSLA